jgi:site-specific recombinase XerD
MSTQLIPFRPPAAPLWKPIDHYVNLGRDAMRQSKAHRTREAYASDWKQFLRWCEQHHQMPLPATVEAIVAYLSYMASAGRKPTTMARHLVSISLAHKAAGFDDPPVATTPVREAMKGFRRMLGVKRDKKTALRRDDLQRIFREMDDPSHSRAIRDRALLLLGFAGAFRRSELVALTVEDLEFVPEGVTVTVRRSKSDQEGQGMKKAIHRGGKLCPVSALELWLKTAGITTGGIFRRIHRSGAIGTDVISGESVAAAVKKYAALIGKDAKQFGGHSLRRGFCTAGAAAGMNEVQLMRVTGHKDSKMLREYVAEATLFDNNTSALLGL